MRGTEGEELVEGGLEVLFGCVGNGVDDVGADVGEACSKGSLYAEEGFLCCVAAP